MQDSMRHLYAREIDRLISELNSYKKEENIWKLEAAVNNCAGNLAFHLAGNLLHFFGTVLLKTDYKRDRENEFSARNIPRTELISELEKAKTVVDQTITSLSDEDLKKAYPSEIGLNNASIEQAIFHLFWHLAYHQGQISYHRRLLDH